MGIGHSFLFDWILLFVFLCGWMRNHCDWNSILESVVSGVPLVAWPLFAEQKMNAVFVSEGMKVAVRMAIGENGSVERGEIARVVKMMMEGEEEKELLHRMKQLKAVATTVGLRQPKILNWHFFFNCRTALNFVCIVHFALN
ncbi:hypothetical protein VIGAN_08204400 [Vigna angularis var. angularis]|uniref:UDP-glycosyltransferases domain-containing protein n=1 Tax=Vigna angularis var. angularis TaxID=157739 RepID=A0A0S3SR83_PHAAN|nr:hypothetical protein VIGAN_08204400 [Vigna angularis var. angularis]